MVLRIASSSISPWLFASPGSFTSPWSFVLPHTGTSPWPFTSHWPFASPHPGTSPWPFALSHPGTSPWPSASPWLHISPWTHISLGVLCLTLALRFIQTPHLNCSSEMDGLPATHLNFLCSFVCVPSPPSCVSWCTPSCFPLPPTQVFGEWVFGGRLKMSFKREVL